MSNTGVSADDLRPESIPATVLAFSEGWSSEPSYLDKFWKRYQTTHPIVLLSLLIKVDIQNRFAAGERPTAGSYFALFPELTTQGDRVISLIYEEFCLLEENDIQVSASEFCDRYQRWRDSLVSQLTYHREFSRAVGQKKPRVVYPSVGERFASYELCSILGEGGAAQVYLATEGQLGGRKVVLKISSSIGVEPSILATLDHRNIIPILTIAESPERGLRGICMPYRPGQTLEAVLVQFAGAGLPRKAKPIWDLLELSKLESELTDIGWKDFPLDGTYTEAVAWLGLAISNALVYLHTKNIYHRDIKPANILLAHREGPLLFDFNLAHTPNAPEYAEAALNGGTLPYMAPEQLRAFLDPAVWDQVGAPADIYAFGLVLRELVTGLKPELPNPKLPLGRAIQDLLDRRHGMARSLKELKPDIPPSLDAIISKCLAYNPADRYLNAKQVGEDLRCFLHRRPLIVASNTSWLELTFNWIYRQRTIASGVFLCLILFGFFIATFQPNRHSTSHLDSEELPLLAPGGPGHTPLAISAAPAFDPLTDAELRKAISLLKSADRTDWEKAKSTFEILRKRHEWSAKPLLYLAECYVMLKQKGANELISLACMKSDAEEAFQVLLRAKLDEKSSPVNTLVTLGYYYELRRNGDRSRDYYRQALSLDPENAGANRGLARFEDQNGHYLLAMELYQRSVNTLDDRMDSRADLKFEVRLAIVGSAFKQVDRLFGQPSILKRDSEIRELLDEVQRQLAIVRDQVGFDHGNEGKSLNNGEWNRQQGLLHSRLSKLFCNQNQPHDAIQERLLALDWFRQATDLVKSDDNHQPAHAELVKAIRQEQQELESTDFTEKCLTK